MENHLNQDLEEYKIKQKEMLDYLCKLFDFTDADSCIIIINGHQAGKKNILTSWRLHGDMRDIVFSIENFKSIYFNDVRKQEDTGKTFSERSKIKLADLNKLDEEKIN